MKTDELYGLIAVFVVLLVIGTVLSRRPRKLKQDQIAHRWQSLQKRCANKKEWHIAIQEADALLDEVLKKGRYKGKSTGERLVSAQHTITNNESVWFGHKLHNRLIAENLVKVSKQDTLEALSGFRQALKDLGALADHKQEDVRSE